MVQIKTQPPVEPIPGGSGISRDLELVRVNLPEIIPFPVYAPPRASIRDIWATVRKLEPSDFWRHAAILPKPGQVFRAGRKLTERNPVSGLKKGVEI